MDPVVLSIAGLASGSATVLWRRVPSPPQHHLYQPRIAIDEVRRPDTVRRCAPGCETTGICYRKFPSYPTDPSS